MTENTNIPMAIDPYKYGVNNEHPSDWTPSTHHFRTSRRQQYPDNRTHDWNASRYHHAARCPHWAELHAVVQSHNWIYGISPDPSLSQRCS